MHGLNPWFILGYFWGTFSRCAAHSNLFRISFNRRIETLFHESTTLIPFAIPDAGIILLIDHLHGLMTHHLLNPSRMFPTVQHRGRECVSSLMHWSGGETSFLQSRFPHVEIHRHRVNVLAIRIEKHIIRLPKGFLRWFWSASRTGGRILVVEISEMQILVAAYLKSWWWITVDTL